MKFSLLIANYNNGKFFKTCYDSIISQTYTDWEAIIVDDGSTDNSVQIIQQLIADDDRFKLYENKKNYGCGYTKRKCVELANGTVCCFIDPDDALTPDALERNYTAYKNNRDIVLTHSDFYYCDKNLINQQRSNKTSAVNNRENTFFNLNYEVFHLVTFLKKAYNQTTGIDPYMQRAVDQDLYLKMAETGKFYYLNIPLYFYRIHDNSLSAGDKSKYWHWFAILATAKRRNIDVEEQFVAHFIARRDYTRLENSVNNSTVLKMWNHVYKYIKKLYS